MARGGADRITGGVRVFCLQIMAAARMMIRDVCGCVKCVMIRDVCGRVKCVMSAVRL